MDKLNLISKMANLSVKRILIIQTAFLGDVILITPLIRAVKAKYPESLLDVLVIKENAEVLLNNPHINSIYQFDKKNKKIISFFHNVMCFRKNKYDIVFSPHSSMTTGFLIFMSGIKYRVGFARWLAQWFLNIKVEHQASILKIKKNLSLLSHLDGNEYPIQTELYPSEIMRNKAGEIISELKKNSKKIIAIAPGSVWETKMWLLENYKKLVNELNLSKYGIVLIGSGNERGVCDGISRGTNAINLAGELTVLESAAIIELCDLMICNDSGAMHIANAMQTDVFAFFGPTTKDIGYAPFRGNDFVFQIDLDCRPCGSHGSNTCPLGHFNCMKKISPEEVLEKINKKFGL